MGPVELHEILAAADAPDALTRWARDHDHDSAWEACVRGESRVWLGAASGAPIDALVEAAAMAVYVADARAPESPPRIGQTLDAAIAGAEPEALTAAADACEQVAEGGTGEYRRPTDPGLGDRARAAALVARAAEARIAGDAMREAARLERARGLAVNLGIGMQSVLPRRDGPARLDVVAAASDPAQGNFLFAVAACAEACRHAVDALVALDVDAGEARRAIDVAVRDALTDDESEVG